MAPKYKTTTRNNSISEILPLNKTTKLIRSFDNIEGQRCAISTIMNMILSSPSIIVAIKSEVAVKRSDPNVAPQGIDYYCFALLHHVMEHNLVNDNGFYESIESPEYKASDAKFRIILDWSNYDYLPFDLIFHAYANALQKIIYPFQITSEPPKLKNNCDSNRILFTEGLKTSKETAKTCFQLFVLLVSYILIYFMHNIHILTRL